MSSSASLLRLAGRGCGRATGPCCVSTRPALSPQCLPSSITATSHRPYRTRAHPKPTPTVPIIAAVESILEGCDVRHAARLERWNTDNSRRVERRIAYLGARGGASAPTPDEVKADIEKNGYRRMDETVEVALQLNLDPRKPGQSLRGGMTLPHGSGKTFGVAVFTDDEGLAEEAKEKGAVAAGGSSLIESIRTGELPTSSFQRTVATPDMVPQLAPIARILGPRGLMPNPKVGTVLDGAELIDGLLSQMSGTTNYRTDRDGIIRLGVGRASFGPDAILDNIRELMNEIQSVKPESFGKGKKGKGKKASKGTKYYLTAHLTSTQETGSVLVDLRTIDPTSSFFMSDPLKV